MKKRFLNRVQTKYLCKRFPENLAPAKTLNKNGKQVRRGTDKTTAWGRSTGFSPQLKRGAKGIRYRRLALNCSPLLKIDTLERGSLAPSLVRDSIVPRECSYQTPRQGKSEHRPLTFSSSKVWVESDNSPSGSIEEKNARPRTLFVTDKGQRKQATCIKDARKGPSLYSPSQLEGGLSRQQEKRSSPLLLQLMEKKKLRVLYGNLSNREVSTLIRKAAKGRGGLSDILFRLLESRLDVVLCKIGFFPTMSFARQWVCHGKVLVNNKITTLANYLLQPGDIISVAPSYCHLLKSLVDKRASSPCIDLWKNLGSHFDTLPETIHLFPSCIAERPTAGDSHREGSQETPGKRGDRHVFPWSMQNASFNEDNLPPLASRSDPPPVVIHKSLAPRTLAKILGSPMRAPSHRVGKEMSRLVTWQIGEGSAKHKLRLFSLKLTHIEISFRLLVAVYLYPPQKVLLPAAIDIEKILKS